MPDTFQLEIVTPEKKVLDTAAEEVQIPGKNGYLGILPGHAPLITELAVGEIKFRAGGEEQRLAVAWGFAEVLPDKVTVLAESAERPSEIDVERARKAKERAEQRLTSGDVNVDVERALNAIHKAETRLEWQKRGSDPHCLTMRYAAANSRAPRCQSSTYGTFTLSRISDGTYFTAAVRSSLSHANLRPSRARFSVLNNTTENNWR